MVDIMCYLVYAYRQPAVHRRIGCRGAENLEPEGSFSTHGVLFLSPHSNKRVHFIIGASIESEELKFKKGTRFTEF